MPAHFSGVWACSCFRAGGLFAWGPSRAQQPPQAPPQALGQAPQALEQAPRGSPLALAPRAQARAPRRHFPPFLFRKILIFVVQKNRKGNAGAAGVYDITVHVGELEAQIAQSNRAVEPHEMSLVGSGLHDKADPFVDNELANDILSEGALDFGSVRERGAPQKELAVGVHRDEVVDLQGTVDETWPQKVVDGERPAGCGARREAPGAGELAPELGVVQHTAVPVVGDLDLVVGGTDCVIRELCEDAQVLQQWTERLGVPYRGQRLAGASLDVFLHLLQGKREDTRSRREELLARQQGMCKLCGAPITLGTFEIDHVIPVAQSFSGQQQELQALCLECHRTKTSLEGSHSTTLESRFCRYVYQNYTATPRLPPLVFQLQKWDLDRPCQGIDVCRCRKNGLANARFPLPVFCPLDCILPSEEGQLADLMWVDLPCDHRKGVLDRLPFVGKGWYAKPVCAYLLEAGLAQWQHFKWSLDATAHVDQRCLELVLERMEQNWPEGEEHYAKLAINSLVGLFARNLELVYSMKTSNHQVDGEGCSWRQTFTDSAGRTHWDHIFVTELLSNSSYRPIHDYIMGAEYVAVARIRQALAEVPRRYLKCIKTDCLVMQDVPKKYRPAVERLLRMSHRDGTPVYRYEEVAGLKGQYREPSMEAEPIRAKAPWRRVEDPVGHCLDGESLLLTGFPGTGKTHLAKKIVEALREHGDTVHIITKTHAAVQNVGLGAQTADHWVRRNVRNGHCSATWLVIEELTQLDTPLWADIACLSMNKKIRFLLLGDFRQLPAVLDSFAGAEVCRELKNSQLLHDLAGGWCHELSERWRFDEQIFEFLTWLRVDEAEQVSLPEALREARQRFPRRGEPDVSLVISHAKRLQINDRENRRLAPPGALVLRYEARGAVPTNAPQTMRVWPGLRLIGAGGKVQKGTFVTVEAVEGDVVRLESGQSFAGQELLKHTRLCSAITYASVQGLTLRGRVWLYDVESPHFTLKHLYMGCSRATSSELLSVL